MGIPSYFNYIIKHYGEIFKYKEDFNEIHNLFLDSNSIIYDCLRKLEFNDYVNMEDPNGYFEDKLISLVCDEINTYVKKLDVSQLVYIAFDGVAPVAKLKQQQTRRYKSSILNELSDRITTNDNTPVKKKWDQCAITPGTEFMNKLTVNITNYYEKLNNTHRETQNVRQNVRKKENIHYIVSGTDEYGEGEHKIFEYIRNNEVSLKFENNFIYGLDADLIMLSLSHLNISNNIFLSRELPPFNSPLNDLYGENDICIMDISKYSNEIYKTMTDYYGILTKSQVRDITSNISNNDGKHRMLKIRDYIFISFFLGNDFLPHFPSLNIRTYGIQYIMDTYKKTVKINEFLTHDNGINWKILKKFIEELAQQEYSYLMNEYKIMENMETKKIKNSTQKEREYSLQTLPVYNRDKEKIIAPSNAYWQNRYYNVLFHIDVNSKARGNTYKKNICINYLEGLEWTYLYYTRNCINYQWLYKYSYPPLLEDLVKYVPVFNCKMVEDNNVIVHPYTQLAYVLPKTSLNLLPNNISNYMLKNHNELYYKQHDLVWAFCKYIWEAHIEIPDIDIGLLNDIIIANINLSDPSLTK